MFQEHREHLDQWALDLCLMAACRRPLPVALVPARTRASSSLLYHPSLSLTPVANINLPQKILPCSKVPSSSLPHWPPPIRPPLNSYPPLSQSRRQHPRPRHGKSTFGGCYMWSILATLRRCRRISSSVASPTSLARSSRSIRISRRWLAPFLATVPLPRPIWSPLCGFCFLF
jgi:hypothetical protein